MNILIVGLGSIGKRHLTNLIFLGYKDIFLVSRNGNEITNFEEFKVFPSVENACQTVNFDYAIIATPTAIHYQDFMTLSKYNISNIYIEKPISHKLKEAYLIESMAKKNNINVTVGFDLHFDLGLTKVKELVDNKVIGDTLTFQAEVGQYLPDWRPLDDYRKGMSAKKELGGGVMLDLIHEFDYLNWILGPINGIFGKNGHISNLEIETEDVAINIIITKNGTLGTVNLDYLQKELSRTCKIIGNNGTIIWNYSTSTVKWMTHKNPIWKKFEYKNFERNDRFIAILKAFMSSKLNDKDHRLSNIKDAIKSLRIVACAKKSNLENKLIKV